MASPSSAAIWSGSTASATSPKKTLKHRVSAMFISTAVIGGDYLYTYNNVGVPQCFEWKTGNELWKSQITERPGGSEAWGSLVLGGKNIYIIDRNGTTSVFATGPKYEHLALNRLNEHTEASLAIFHGDLFIRTYKHLWCISSQK